MDYIGRPCHIILKWAIPVSALAEVFVSLMRLPIGWVHRMCERLAAWLEHTILGMPSERAPNSADDIRKFKVSWCLTSFLNPDGLYRTALPHYTEMGHSSLSVS